jgi:RNA polymerase sigma-70 factor (ECF subfamily)
MSVEHDAIITAVYRAYRDPLMTFVLRLTAGDRGQAEDVIQETMVRAWREAGQLDLSGPSLMPWLATVARRIVIDLHRRRQLPVAEPWPGTLADTATDDESASTILRIAIADAMRDLSPAHRQVLSETILRDRTASQAAQVLGIPVGTVKSRVFHALRALEVILAERGLWTVPPAEVPAPGAQALARIRPGGWTCPRP